MSATVVVPQSVSKPTVTDTTSTSYLLCNFVSGGLANAISRTAVAPFERMRLSMQVDSQRYTSTIQCLRDIVKHEGVTGLYRGNLINVVRIFPQGGLSFYVKDLLKDVMSRGQPDGPTALQLGVASTASGAICMTAVYPLDMVRAQVSILPKNTFPSMYAALKYNATQPGVGLAGLYKGCSYSVLWSSVYYGVQFMCYDTLKYYYIQRRAHKRTSQIAHYKDDTISPSVGFLFGSIAGTICTTVAFPLESARRKLQLQGLAGRPVMYTGMRHCLRTVLNNGGVSELFNGLVPNLVKSPIAVALIFSIHEALMQQAKQHNVY